MFFNYFTFKVDLIILMKSTIYLAVIILLFYSCTPKIYQFNPTPLTISKDDSVFITWKVRGKATLIVHNKEPEISYVDSNTKVKYEEFTLVVTKKKKEVKSKKQITVVLKNSTDVILFNAILKGDTLIAAGTNNEETWNDKFVIGKVASASNRSMIVSHADKKSMLDSSGSYSDAFEGTPVKGKWEFRSLLTTAEKEDMSLAPANLRISVTIKYKNL